MYENDLKHSLNVCLLFQRAKLVIIVQKVHISETPEALKKNPFGTPGSPRRPVTWIHGLLHRSVVEANLRAFLVGHRLPPVFRCWLRFPGIDGVEGDATVAVQTREPRVVRVALANQRTPWPCFQIHVRKLHIPSTATTL